MGPGNLNLPAPFQLFLYNVDHCAVIQTSLIPLGQEGIHMGIGDLRFNMYTTTGWLAAACSLIYVILLMPGIFQEFDMAEKEAQWTKMKGLKTEAEQSNKNGNNSFQC